MMWDEWCNAIDRHPFYILLLIFSLIWTYEAIRFGGPGLVYPPLIFVVSFLFSVVLSVVLKLYFKEARDKDINTPMGYRRPSAHTLIAATLSTVASLLDMTLVPVLGFFVAITALARLHIGAHKLQEVIEGGIEGIILGFLLYIAMIYVGFPIHY